MKKLLLSIVALTVVTASFATKSPFEKNKERALARKKAIEKFEMQNRSAATIDVAKTTKYSYWDMTTNAWNSSYATDATYANDRLVSELQLSYTLTDTFGKIFYNYDANGRYTSVESKEYNPMTHTYSDGARKVYTYTSNGSYVELYESYDTQTSTWTPSYRTSYVFNSRKAQIKVLSENYSNGLWSVSYGYSRNLTYYNNTNKIVQEIDSSYNQSTLTMEASYGMIRSFNSAGQILRIENYSYDNNVATLEEVDSLKYDGAGLPISLTLYDPITMVAMMRMDNITWNGTFNPDIDLFDNQPASYLMNMYNNNTWVLAGRFTTSYPDNYGSQIQLEEVYENNVYIPDYKYSTINDFNFHLIEESSQAYDAATSTWTVNYGNQYTYQYDVNNRITEYISKQRYNMDTAYINNQKMEYSNFINVVAGVNHSSNTLEVKLYPNPSANGNVNINLNLEKASNISIAVMDINGRIVSSQEVNLGTGLNTVQLSNLNTGLYFVEVVSDYGVSKTKIIVAGN